VVIEIKWSCICFQFTNRTQEEEKNGSPFFLAIECLTFSFNDWEKYEKNGKMETFRRNESVASTWDLAGDHL
jgi:hypothetical protein